MKHILAAVFVAACAALPLVSQASIVGPAPYLSCVATYPVVSVGNAGRFHVVTNINGPFMWIVADEGYSVLNTGSEFATPFTHVGPQEVTVTWGDSRRANCQVDVVAAPGYGEPYHAPAMASTQASALNVTLSSIAYPRLPNAGFEPKTLAAFAFAVVFLLGASIALYPHAKKAFSVVTR